MFRLIRLVAVAVLMGYWVSSQDVSNAVWIAVALAFCFVINLFPAAVYGETEFILWVKIVIL